MGENNSKETRPKPEPEPPLLGRAWREMKWGDEDDALEFVNGYEPHIEDLQIRILLHGLSGAGKSSFVNSVQSVLKDRISTLALVGNATQGSFTKEYKTYKMETDVPNNYYPFRLSDMWGMKCKNYRAAHLKDLELMLRGHMKNGYRFNGEQQLSDKSKFFIKSPKPINKVHVLVFVVDASTKVLMSEDAVATLRYVRGEASRLGIPQVAIFTKIDRACPEVRRNLKNVYKSRELLKKMRKFHSVVGIPMNCIFPVRNYHSEINLNDDANTLILSALSHIINAGDEFLKNKYRG